MMRKTYQLKTPFSSKVGLRVDTLNGSAVVIFESKRHKGICEYTTTDKEIQDAIENSKRYDEGGITLSRSERLTAEPVAEKVVQPVANDMSDAKDISNLYATVTTYKEAREILSAEPYGVPVSHLGNSTAIHTKADELGVSFPNLGNG